jgi:DNA-directed RNA polymerase subunit RPC12/RpoP
VNIRFSLDGSAPVYCAKCKADRGLPSGKIVAQGDMTHGAQTSEPCPHCGHDRVVIKARVKQIK